MEDQGGDLQGVTHTCVTLENLNVQGGLNGLRKTDLHVRKERAGVIRQVVVFDGLFSAQRSVKVCVQIEQGLALR